MSVRGLKFLDKWVAKQLPIVARGDLILGDLKDQVMTAAEKAGIPAGENNGELESVFELIIEVNRRGAERADLA
ncbi:hypothetical protein NKH85_04240 [Mesorhizobium sp. M0924]|uniref:hypothetical protein n=1 Tax=unclassified Mesorhizobium TaxID=325217 RepID=UPI003338E2F0